MPRRRVGFILPALLVVTGTNPVVFAQTCAPSSASKELDLTWEECDTNGFPLNARWLGQGNPSPATKLPAVDVAKACGSKTPFGRDRDFALPACTSQKPLANLSPPISLCWLEKLFGGDPLLGHVSYRTATYTGQTTFTELSNHLDGDYNVSLRTPANEGATQPAHSGDGVGLEFRDRETLLRYRTDFWHAIAATAHSEAADPEAEPGFPETRALWQDKTAVVIGEMNLDCEHGCYSELHPVYALALRLGNDSDADDKWVFFARNVGTQGICSSEQLVLKRTVFEMMLPRPGTASADPRLVTKSLYAGPSAGYRFGVVAQDGKALLHVEVPVLASVGSNDAPYLEGTFTLRWTPAPPEPRARAESTERALQELFKQLPVKERTRIEGVKPKIEPYHREARAGPTREPTTARLQPDPRFVAEQRRTVEELCAIQQKPEQLKQLCSQARKAKR